MNAVHLKLAALARYAHADLLELLGEHHCVLGYRPYAEDEYERLPYDMRWIVYQIDDHYNATAVGFGATPGAAMVSALVCLCGVNDDGTFAPDANDLNDEAVDELRRAHNTVSIVLDTVGAKP